MGHAWAILADVTDDLDRARQALARSEARLLRVTEAVPGVIFEATQSLDLVGAEAWEPTFVSGQVESLLGLPRDAVLANRRVLASVLPEAELYALSVALEEGAADQRPVDFQCPTSPGTPAGWIRVWARCSTVGGPAERQRRWTGFVVDATEARQIQEGLRQSQRLEVMSALSAGIAHNFNNMLAAIVPNLDMAIADAPPSLRAPLEESRLAAASAADLVEQLLIVARGGETSSSPRVVYVREVVREVVKICRRTFDPAIALTLELPEEPLPVWGAATPIQQVLLNLLINARDAVEGRRHAQIVLRGRARAVGGRRWAHLEVEDNGIGMPPEVLARVGQPFFTTKPAGTGLGVASLYGIVHDLGGRVDVHSEVDVGSRFEVWLPLTEAPPVEEAPPPEVLLSDVVGRRVLVIDDEELVLDAVRRVLTSQGVEVVVARSGEAGLEKVDHHVDAVLLDWSMPGLPGEVVLARLKATRPELPVAVVTGHGRFLPELARVETVLAKPVGAAALLEWLQRVWQADRS